MTGAPERPRRCLAKSSRGGKAVRGGAVTDPRQTVPFGMLVRREDQLRHVEQKTKALPSDIGIQSKSVAFCEPPASLRAWGE